MAIHNLLFMLTKNWLLFSITVLGVCLVLCVCVVGGRLGFNSEIPTCKVGPLYQETRLQSIFLLWLFEGVSFSFSFSF
jgi:hypothetical protein